MIFYVDKDIFGYVEKWFLKEREDLPKALTGSVVAWYSGDARVYINSFDYENLNLSFELIRGIIY